MRLVKRTCENCRYFKMSDNKNNKFLGSCFVDPPPQPPAQGRGRRAYTTELGCRYWEAKV